MEGAHEASESSADATHVSEVQTEPAAVATHPPPSAISHSPPKKTESSPGSSGRRTKSRVEMFLLEHGLDEYIEIFSQNGFDDLEDLVELVQHHQESSLAAMMPKVGHRIKLIRSVHAVCSRDLQSPTLTKDALSKKDQDDVESVNESIMSYVSAMPARGKITSVNNLDERDNSLAMSAGCSPAPSAVTRASARLDDPARKEREARRKGDVDRRRVSSLNMAGINPGMPNAQRQVSVKVVVVGQGGSGKSSFIARLVRNEYSDSVRTTLGVEFSEKKFMVGSTVVSLQFWDVWGQENSMSATRSYYTGARGAIVMYDATDASSLDKAVVWKRDIDSKARFGSSGLSIPVVLVGSKYDLSQSEDGMEPNSPASVASGPTNSQSKVKSQQPAAASLKQPVPNNKTALKTSDEIQDFCNTHNVSGHFFASAKTGLCVRSVAEYLVLAVLKMDPHDTEPTDHRVVTLDHQTRARRATGLEAPDEKKKKKGFRCVMH